MNVRSVKRIENLNYILGAVLIFSSVVLATMDFTAGIAIGVVLSCINFSLIRRMVAKLLVSTPDVGSRSALVFIPKMTGLLALVALIAYFAPVSVLGVGIGFSVFIISIAVEGVCYATDSPSAD